MDDELEDWMLPNNTDELDNFAFNLTAWDIVQDTTAIAFTTVGLVSDILIIYMIARNARMRSKTNLLLMNFAINNACFLMCNVHFLASIVELTGYTIHFSYQNNCVLQYLDIGFQLNESLFLLLIISNTLIKSKRIQIKWLLITVYILIALNYIIYQITCHYRLWPVCLLLGGIVILSNFATVLFKEFNNCYKKWYKQDPLSGRTLFRLNLGKIYAFCWVSTFIMYMFEGVSFLHFYILNILTQHIYLTGFYMLLYIVYADKNFKICLLDLVRFRGTGGYDVDATITFDDELSEDSRDNNQVNINFNAMENAARSQIQGITTIQVP